MIIIKVKYTEAKDVIIIMNDNENDTRELCYSTRMMKKQHVKLLTHLLTYTS